MEEAAMMESGESFIMNSSCIFDKRQAASVYAHGHLRIMVVAVVYAFGFQESQSQNMR
jgi:hypothetical protein